MGSVFRWNERTKNYIEMFFVKEPDSILIDIKGVNTCFDFNRSGVTHVRKGSILERKNYADDCLIIKD